MISKQLINMKTLFTTLVLLAGLYGYIEACTVIAIGKKASADGSVIVEGYGEVEENKEE